MSIYDPDALECLAAIVEEGGFERAAQRLSITQSAVSQRLRSLESQVGTVLIVRSRPLKVTTAGQLMLKHAKMMRLLRADLQLELKELAPNTSHGIRDEDRISVAINADSIATWVLPALSPLIQRGLPIEIIHDDQDFTLDWLRSGQVMGCVTSLDQSLRGCKMEPLGTMRYVAVAHPDFAQREIPQGLSPYNFHRLPFLTFNRKDDLQREFVSRAFDLPHVMLRQVYVPSSEGQVRAALAGWGISVVPELLVREALQQGTLTNVAPLHILSVKLYWHCWNLASDVLNQLSQVLRSAATEALAPPEGGASVLNAPEAPAPLNAPAPESPPTP